MTTDDVRQLLRDKVTEAGTAVEWARGANVSPAYVGDVLKGSKEPGRAILSALGLERVISYRKLSAVGERISTYRSVK